jgi:hypothetical protein
VDLGVGDGFEVGCGVVLRPEAEYFEAGAGGCVVYYVEGLGWGVVFDSEGVEVGCCGGEVEECDRLRRGVGRGGVVVGVEGALGAGGGEDALCWGPLVRLHARRNIEKMA